MLLPPALAWLFVSPFLDKNKKHHQDEGEGKDKDKGKGKEPEHHSFTDNMVDFIAGCLGGVAGVIVGHPLDTVKVHMQTHGSKKYGSTWGCMTTLVRNENFRSLYKGITSPMAGIGMVNAIVFGVYGNVNRYSDDPHSLKSHIIAGSVAGLIQSVISSPLELAKLRMQLQHGQTHYKGPYDCMKHIWKTEGIRGTFKGLTMTALRDVPGFGGYFFCYEYIMRIPERQTGPWTLLAGGCAGMFSWFCCYPFDVLKTCVQAESSSGKGNYRGGWDCAVQNYRAHGYRYFLRGINSTLLRAFPSNAACFFVVAFILRLKDGKKIDLVVNTNEQMAMLHGAATPLSHVHQIEEENGEIQQKRAIMARNLQALGAFNEAVNHNEAEELANDLYPDNNKYYIYEDKRLTNEPTTENRIETVEC